MRPDALARAVKENAQRLAPGLRMRPGTVALDAPDPARVVVLVDGDSTPVQMMSLTGPLLLGQRVMVLFQPPHGAYVIGDLSPTPTSAPAIGVFPQTARTGDALTVDGTDWIPGAVALAWDNPAGSLGTPTADASGRFTASVTVPAGSPQGNHLITATEGTRVAYAAVAVGAAPGTPFISLTPNTGQASSASRVDGSGFPADASVNVTFDGSAAIGAFHTDGGGSFSGTVTIPAGASDGAHTITATSGSATASAGFSVVSNPPGTPQLSLSPSSGRQGDSIVATATGFVANGPNVDFDWDNPALTSASSGPDSAGTATGYFPVPIGAPQGAHTITATDGANTATAQFSVDVPPPGNQFDALAGHSRGWRPVNDDPLRWGWFGTTAAFGQGELEFFMQQITAWIGNEVCPVWGNRPAPISTWFDSEGEVPAGYWKVEFTDDPGGPPGCSSCGGIHYFDGAVPHAFIYTDTAHTNNDPNAVSVIASHECAEMIVDPYDQLSGSDFYFAEGEGGCFAVEVGDMVEDSPYRDDNYGSVVMTNFVLPAWYTSGASPPYTQVQRYGGSDGVTGPFHTATDRNRNGPGTCP